MILSFTRIQNGLLRSFISHKDSCLNFDKITPTFSHVVKKHISFYKIRERKKNEKRQNFEERLKRNLKRISEERMAEEEIENTGKWKG